MQTRFFSPIQTKPSQFSGSRPQTIWQTAQSIEDHIHGHFEGLLFSLDVTHGDSQISIQVPKIRDVDTLTQALSQDPGYQEDQAISVAISPKKISNQRSFLFRAHRTVISSGLEAEQG